MSIFVNQDALVTISVRYVEIRNGLGQVVGVSIIPDNSPEVDSESTLNCKARGRDFDTMSKIMEECTFINHITGNPVIRTKDFIPAIIDNFFVEWDAKDSGGNIVPVTCQSVSVMFYQMSKKLASKWLQETSRQNK